MQRLLMLAAALTIYAASAVADPLKGAFGFGGSDVCLYASGGFNANLQALGTPPAGRVSTEPASQGTA
jgi:hypothetical protein